MGDWRLQARGSLEEERQRFRAALPADPAESWQGFGGRIGVVLSGGGARGAYEAGVLRAFQDATLPTHILTSTSIGSINAASYAAFSKTYVGNAGPLIDSWFDVTPSAVGIDWSRYIVILAGLVCASAGFGNLARYLVQQSGIYVHLVKPIATWFALGMAGLSLLFFYSQLSYLYHVIVARAVGWKWRPDPKKLALSLAANLCVWIFLFLCFNYIHVARGEDVLWAGARSKALLAAGAVLAVLCWLLLRNRLSALSHGFLRLPLRSGLFPNFERARFLRERIPVEGLRRSPIRVVFTVADVKTGKERYFSNASLNDLVHDAGAAEAFVRAKMETAEDLLQAVIASSAYPMAYELTAMNSQLWMDGGIVAIEPVRPAIRLGADVLFLVMAQPVDDEVGNIQTFLDVAIRTFDILMSQNLKSDLSLLETANRICTEHAAKLGVRPEEVRLEVGGRRYRYVKSFTVRPSSALHATLLDFDGRIVAPDIVRGYRDGAAAVTNFLSYLLEKPEFTPKYLLRLQPEEVRIATLKI